MKTFKVYWTEMAELDLEEIIDYISRDSRQAAESIYKKIKSKCAQLKTYPERYRIVPELLDISIKDYREIILPPYRIIYKLIKKEVYVIAVVDSRRDFESFLYNRLLRK